MSLSKFAGALVERRQARHLRLTDRPTARPAVGTGSPGLHAAGDRPLLLNDAVWVHLSPGAALASQVVWVHDDECGLAFDRNVERAREPNHDRAEAERFRAGMRVTVLGDGGAECSGLVQWLSGNIASVRLIPAPSAGGRSNEVH